MPKKGISLKFDSSGGIKAVSPEEGELCCGIVTCSQCKGNICQISKPRQSSFELKKCPAHKWFILWYAPGHDPTKFVHYPKDTCQTCGAEEAWRLSKKDIWVCEICHPPSPKLKKIEHGQRKTK